MSTDRDVTRIVRSWLHEDAYEDADRILNLVLAEIDTTPQRSAPRQRRPRSSLAVQQACACARFNRDAAKAASFPGYNDSGRLEPLSYYESGSKLNCSNERLLRCSRRWRDVRIGRFS